MTFRCGAERFNAERGAFVFLPRGIEHGYTIRSEGEVRLLVLTSPAPDGAQLGWGGFVSAIESQGKLHV